MFRLIFFIVAWLGVWVVSSQLKAFETDQYRVWTADDLKDSAEELNRILNKHLQILLDKKINHPFRLKVFNQRTITRNRVRSKHLVYRENYLKQKKPYTADQVARKFLKHVRPHFFRNRLLGWIKKEGEFDLFPLKPNMLNDYSKSIHGGFIWPFIMPVMQNMNVNGVYFGLDKLDHFFSSGRRYFNIYVNKRKKGFTHEEAMKAAVNFGVSWVEESGILGTWAIGIFSYADLESNFQGMQMGIDLCCRKDPLLVQDKDGRWKINRPIDVRKYINPLWDEAFNNNYLAKYRRRKVQKKIREKYCELGKTKEVRSRWKRYQNALKPSFHTEYLTRLIEEGKIPNPSPQSISKVCGYPEGVLEGVSFWMKAEEVSSR